MNFKTKSSLALLCLGSLVIGPSGAMRQSVAADLFSFGGLKPVSSLRFQSSSQAVLPGKGRGTPQESLGDVGIALRFEQDNYWTSDNYSAQSYTVSGGTINDDQGRIGTALPAYKISKPTYSAGHKFVASNNDLFYRFSTKQDFVVYSVIDPAQTVPAGAKAIRFGDSILIESARIAAAAITPGQFLKIPNVTLNDLESETVFVFAPASRVLDSSSSVGTNVSASIVAQTAYGAVARFSYDLNGIASLASTSGDDAAGPAPTYGQNPRFPLMVSGSGLDVGFQDSANSTIRVFKLAQGNKSSTISMPLSLANFGSMTRDSAGNYFYLALAAGTNPQTSLVKTDSAGKQLARTDLGNAENQFDISTWRSATASMVQNGDSLCVLFSRIYQSGHQGSTAAVFNSNDLALKKNLGQNAGHSFENRLIKDGSGFVSLDLGDNYPRGIVIHKISDSQKTSRVIFTYKTQHSTSPKGDLPAGRWSNDNSTYTELGDVVATNDGYLSLFGAEKSVDNAMATSGLNESRNVGFVVAKSSLGAAQTDFIVTRDIVNSQGEDSPEFSFYNFGGTLKRQKNAGVTWLTKYTDKATETAARPKVVDLGDGRFVALWEKWSQSAFQNTYAQIFSGKGELLSPQIELGAGVRLARGEKIVRIGDCLVWPTASTNRLELNVWRFQLTSNQAPTLANATFNATKDVAFSQQLAGRDADSDALSYKVTAGTLPTGLNLSATGLLSGTPTQSGSSVVTVEVSDGKGGVAAAQITVAVKSASLEATLSPTAPKTNETLTASINATSPDGSELKYAYLWKKNDQVIAGENKRNLDLSKAGNGDKNDVISCEVTATGANGAQVSATAKVTVVNSAPVAISSKGEVAADTEKGFALQGFDADGDALTYKRVGGPTNGVMADIRVDPTDGKIKLFYRSRPFYGGVDIIRFVAFDSDNKQSNESTLGINVLYTSPPPPNRAPVAGDTNIETYVGKSEIKGLLGSDPDGDPITFRIVGNAKYGKSEIKRDSDGQFKLFYTSLNRFYGDDRVTYLATDSRGKESNLATVNIRFTNRAPIAQSNRIGVASGAEVSQYLFGSDEDGDALTFRLVNNPRHGRGAVQLDAQGKWRFYYQSVPGYVGSDQITFIAIDPMGRESSVAAIDINVVRAASTPSALQSSAAPSGGGA